ncbi:MAG: S8 family serine peptidase [Chloroflexi bacterium]|nr:S8 family serine peptidase [Chloroflexota bacterium]
MISSNGTASDGKYIGIAPEANLVSIKASDDEGTAYVSDVISALQWAVENRDAYNIRVINLSVVQQMPDSYLTSPLDAAVEMTWLSGIVVVVSAGNLGPDSALYPPANDPFVITVGATDTIGTPDIADDVIPAWSSHGTTQDGFTKPDVVAPGRRIVSNLSAHNSVLGTMLPDRIVDGKYIRLSGTSMAAPMVSGIVALALQAHPNWTPDQVKAALVKTARPLAGPGSGAGEVDAAGVVSDVAPGYANRGLPLNLGVAEAAGNIAYDSTTWNSTTWNSTTWNSTTWNSTTWNSTTWNSTTWNSTTWNSTTWNSTTWNSTPLLD